MSQFLPRKIKNPQMRSSSTSEITACYSIATDNRLLFDRELQL